MAALPSAYWVRIGERTHIRLVLPDDEDAATDALARLHAAGEDGLGGDTRLLGAFRACGLLVPVWDLDPELEAADHEDELAAWGERYAAALASDAPLTAEERRARVGTAEPPGHPPLMSAPRRPGRRRRPVQGRGRPHRGDRGRRRGPAAGGPGRRRRRRQHRRHRAGRRGAPAPTSCGTSATGARRPRSRAACAGCATSSGRMPWPTRPLRGRRPCCSSTATCRGPRPTSGCSPPPCSTAAPT